MARRDAIFAKAAEYIATRDWPHNLSRHCAIVTYRGKIIAVGFNDLKTHTMMLRYRRRPAGIYLHAEIAAISKAIAYFRGNKDRLSDCEIYVARTYKNGNFANSKPCSGCMRAIKDYGFKRVHWTG